MFCISLCLSFEFSTFTVSNSFPNAIRRTLKLWDRNLGVAPNGSLSVGARLQPRDCPGSPRSSSRGSTGARSLRQGRLWLVRKAEVEALLKALRQ